MFSILFIVGTTIMFSRLGYMTFMLWIYNHVHLRNETNLDTRYNLYSFYYGHYNNVLHIGIHDIGALDLQEKPFFPPFAL